MQIVKLSDIWVPFEEVVVFVQEEKQEVCKVEESVLYVKQSWIWSRFTSNVLFLNQCKDYNREIAEVQWNRDHSTERYSVLCSIVFSSKRKHHCECGEDKPLGEGIEQEALAESPIRKSVGHLADNHCGADEQSQDDGDVVELVCEEPADASGANQKDNDSLDNDKNVEGYLLPPRTIIIFNVRIFHF